MPYYLRSFIRSQRQQLAEAEEDARMAVRLKPKEARTHAGLGWMLMLKGRYQEAKDALAEARSDWEVARMHTELDDLKHHLAASWRHLFNPPKSAA